jgi:putative ABC transport system permease protein
VRDVKLYRFLLRMFPRAWRHRYQDEVLGILAEEGGPKLRPSIDLIHSGIVERIRQFQRLVWSGVRFASGRALALGGGLMVAAVAFSLLTASVDVGTARINGVVGQNWRGAYDLLVLPAGSGPSVSTPGHLVEANYLSASPAGITMAQYEQVAHLPGVGVAAPLEVVGYVLETASVPVDVGPVIGTSGATVLTLTSHFTADRGLSRYPSTLESYVYVTPDPLSSMEIDQRRQLVGDGEQLPGGSTVSVCPIALGTQPVQASPFQNAAGVLSGSCYSRQAIGPGPPAGSVVGYVTWSFPVLVAGVDPAAENALTGLGKATVSGRYLSEDEGTTYSGKRGLVVPVLASTTAFDGDVDDVTVERMPASAVALARSQDPAKIADELASESASAKAGAVLHVSISGQQAWQQLLAQIAAQTTEADGGSGSSSGAPSNAAPETEYATIVGQYWSVGGVSYSKSPGGVHTVLPVVNPLSVWQSGLAVVGQSDVYAPAAAADTGFRTLTEHLSIPDPAPQVVLQAIGRFDPYRLTGFARGAASPLASYQAPVLSGVGAASLAALHDQPLLPDGNMAGYAQQPPLLLTTLAGASTLEDPANFDGTSTQASAPIGSVRVRVAGLRGTVPEQLGKIAAVGQEITKATGLSVVVTAGSSPQLVTVALPAGKFGRPSLTLAEPWTAVMVALVVLRQADAESLALFVLILVVCGLFLAGAALAGVRGRREEIAVLRALGWGRHQVFALVLGEVAMLGIVAGAAGVVVSLLLIGGLRIDVPLWRSALVLPVAAVLAVVSGLVPAWLAARVEPAGALAPAARSPRRRGLPVRSITGLALTAVARTPGRCALAGAALATGVAGLAVLLAAQVSFSGSIGDSALAGLVTASTRGTDLASALLAVGLGAASVADVTYLNLRERAGELAALAATGWGSAQLGRLLGTEALVTAFVGSVTGAAAGLAAAGYAFGMSGLVVVGAVAAAAGGTVVALAGTAGVLAIAARRSLAPVLAADA